MGPAPALPTGRDLEEASGDPTADLTVVSFDLDGLKSANDTLGHDGGDALLACFARHLAAQYQHLGAAYRIGGDEFAVLARHHVPEADVRTCLFEVVQGVQGDGHALAGASVGVAHGPGDACTPGDLLRVSDRRMYHEKLQRRSSRGRPGASGR